MNSTRAVLLALGFGMAFVWQSVPSASAEPVTLDIDFKLTDMDYKPLPNVPVRLVFTCDPNWQKPDAGTLFKTDDKGQAHITTKVEFQKVMMKQPGGSMFGELLQLPAPRSRLVAGAELDFMNFPAVYTVDMVYFEDCTAQEDFLLYVKDEHGNFATCVQPTDYARLRPDLGRNVIHRGPGWQPFDGLLTQAKDSNHWALRLAFKKNQPPLPYTP